MKRNVFTIALMLCATMGFAQTAFRVPLSSVEPGGGTLTFGTDAYRIDTRDHHICAEWHPNELCKISEEGSRPECFARIYNEESKTWVRATRMKNEADKKAEKKRKIEETQRQQKLAKQHQEQEREAQIKQLGERQQYLKALKGQLEYQQTRLRAELVQLDRNNRLLAQARPGRRSFFRVITLNKIVELESAIAERESEIKRLERAVINLR